MCIMTYIILCHSLYPSLDIRSGLDHSADRGDGHEVCHDLCLGGRLEIGDLIGDNLGCSLHHSLGLKDREARESECLHRYSPCQ